LHIFFKAKGVPNSELPMKCGTLGIGRGAGVGKCLDLKRFLSAVALRNATKVPNIKKSAAEWRTDFFCCL